MKYVKTDDLSVEDAISLLDGQIREIKRDNKTNKPLLADCKYMQSMIKILKKRMGGRNGRKTSAACRR